MSLLSIATSYESKPFHSKAARAEAIALAFRKECPLASQVNNATLRNMIYTILNFNKHDNSVTIYPYQKCVGSSVSFPIEGHNVILTAVDNSYVLKVCPLCKMTANVSDPICPGCSHFYTDHELEASIVEAAASSLWGEELTASPNATVLDDAVEGIRVTEKDVSKYMHDVAKYIPTKK